LGRKPSILGQSNLPIEKQWEILLYSYDANGIFLSAPNYFIWYLRGSSDIPKFMVAPIYPAGRLSAIPSHPLHHIWQTIMTYFAANRKLILLETTTEVTSMCSYLREFRNIQAATSVHRSHRERLKDVCDFATGRCPLLIGTMSALSGIELLQPAVTIYTKMPRNLKQFRMADGMALIFFDQYASPVPGADLDITFERLGTWDEDFRR
jgi:hypothetical protein